MKKYLRLSIFTIILALLFPCKLMAVDIPEKICAAVKVINDADIENEVTKQLQIEVCDYLRSLTSEEDKIDAFWQISYAFVGESEELKEHLNERKSEIERFGIDNVWFYSISRQNVCVHGPRFSNYVSPTVQALFSFSGSEKKDLIHHFAPIK